MRWSTFIASLDESRQAWLANALTMACGYTSLARRLTAEDRATGVLLTYLDRAAAALQQVWSVLAAPTVPPASPPGPTTVADPAISLTSWREFLARLPADAVGSIEQMVDEAAQAAHRAAELARADGEVEAVRAEVSRALAALARARPGEYQRLAASGFGPVNGNGHGALTPYPRPDAAPDEG
jgi:hypothetical protein